MVIEIDASKLNMKLEKLADADFHDAITAACILVENEAKMNCPVDTGALRNSITHEVDGNEGQVGSNLEYAPLT